MADIIKLLPDHVANQIAAGEVVQRPASVVKELLENAIDAQATTVKLIVKNGGKVLIHVVDDGSGMSDTDARLSFERHATSKIASADDLFKLSTKGFRGEALASIAAIAHVEMLTKPDNSELGTQIRIEGSKVIEQEACASPKGTSIAIKNLFFNIPARRNFLKSDQVELRHIIDEFQRVALVHPDVTFSMYHNGSELFNLPSGNHRQRVTQIFGNRMDERLVPVNETTEVVTVSGFVCKPEFAKKSRGEQFFFANDRFIKSPYLHHAVLSAFEGLLKTDAHPGYFLYLTVDPGAIDINIHPTKTEVKFDDENALYAILRSAIKHSLGQFNIAPILDFERDGNLDTPYHYEQKEASMPTVSVDRTFNPFAAPTQERKSVAGWESLFGDDPKGADLSFSSIEVESEAASSDLFEGTEAAIAQQRSIFQLRNKYIVSTLRSGLLAINQNRAHQRILFERFLAASESQKAVTQQLLFPLDIDLPAKDFQAFQEMEADLVKMGFSLEDAGSEKVKVTGIPVGMTESMVGTVLEDLLASFQDNQTVNTVFSQRELLSKVLSEAMAIKNGQALEMDAQLVLVDDLFACSEPKLSPSGKVVYTTIDLNEIDKRFE